MKILRETMNNKIYRLTKKIQKAIKKEMNY